MSKKEQIESLEAKIACQTGQIEMLTARITDLERKEEKITDWSETTDKDLFQLVDRLSDIERQEERITNYIDSYIEEKVGVYIAKQMKTIDTPEDEYNHYVAGEWIKIHETTHLSLTNQEILYLINKIYQPQDEGKVSNYWIQCSIIDKIKKEGK